MTEVFKHLVSSDDMYQVYEVYLDGVLSGTDTIYVGPPIPEKPNRGPRS